MAIIYYPQPQGYLFHIRQTEAENQPTKKHTNNTTTTSKSEDVADMSEIIKDFA